MSRLVLFLFSIGVAIFGGFEAARWNPFKGTGPKGDGEKMLGTGFSPTPYPVKNKNFTVVVVGYNNGAYAQKTLDSLFRQNYSQFRLVYIDDASNDGSFELARDLIYDSDFMLETTVVRNEERLGVLANLVRAVEGCPDEEIVVVLEGEDWLAHEWVLQRLNAYYADPDLWLTYGQSREFPTFALGSALPVPEAAWKEKGFRGQPFAPGHLRTFYAGLFKKIKESDLIYQGKFLPACSDLAYMLPMLEMAKDHFQCIPETLYIANAFAQKQEEKELQLKCERFIRSLNPYSSLAALELKTESAEESP